MSTSVKENDCIPSVLYHRGTVIAHTHCEAFRVEYVQMCVTLYQYTIWEQLRYRGMMVSLFHSSGDPPPGNMNFSSSSASHY